MGRKCYPVWSYAHPVAAPRTARAAARRSAQAGPGDGTTAGVVALRARLFDVGRRCPRRERWRGCAHRAGFASASKQRNAGCERRWRAHL